MESVRAEMAEMREAPHNGEATVEQELPLMNFSDRIDPEFRNEAARRWFTDVVLTDQTGQAHRLYSDLIRGRTVVVNCFFSTCSGICPVMNRNLKAIQDSFRERMVRELVILSITVDPVTDTPGTLRGYADTWEAGPGWVFLSGTQAEVGEALQRFGLNTIAKEDHKGVFLIGNDRTGLWKRALGLAEAGELLPIVASVLDDPTPAGGGATD